MPELEAVPAGAFLTIQEIQAIHDYLQQRPCHEVLDFVLTLRNAPTIGEDPRDAD